MKASSNGHLPVAEALIQAKADVNATDVSNCFIPVFVTDTSALANRKLEAAEPSLTSSVSLCVSAYDEFSDDGYLVWNKCNYVVARLRRVADCVTAGMCLLCVSA